MTEPQDDDEVDRLLSRGRLGGPRHERMLGKILDERRVARRRRTAFFWGGPLLAMAAVLVLVLRPGDGGFRARGAKSGAVVSVTCRDGSADRCPSGGTLVFRVDGAAEGGYLEAWAEPAGGGSRVRYFAAGAPKLQAQSEPQVVHVGVVLGPEQPAGAWEIHARISAGAARDDAPAPIVGRLQVTQ